jgi:hypothetical protein
MGPSSETLHKGGRADHATVASGITPIPETSEQVSTLGVGPKAVHERRIGGGGVGDADISEPAARSAVA